MVFVWTGIWGMVCVGTGKRREEAQAQRIDEESLQKVPLQRLENSVRRHGLVADYGVGF